MTRQPSPLLRELPYFSDSSRLFDRIASQPWAVFLDSSETASGKGRYDLLAADPMITLITRAGETELTTVDGRVSWTQEDPLRLLQSMLRRYRIDRVGPLPFSGGALGYFAYDLARSLENLPVIAADQDHLPEMAIGLYDWAVVVDHLERRSWLVGCGFDPRTFAGWSQRVAEFSQPLAPVDRAPFKVTGPIESNLSRQQYADAFQHVQRYILDGDCYQVNLAQRFSVTTEGDPWGAYQRLRRLNPAPFSAYLNSPAAQVLCSSPERFLQVRSGIVETRPIKGTVQRKRDPVKDRVQRQNLLQSAKDRAENLMIVDLLRNDLSKNSALGSVKVDQLFALESYATVHHLVSSISSRLAPDRDALDLLRGCFPGGSITGAPKRRAMEIIEQLEPDRRDLYCGSIGYIGFDGNMDTNIAIRTLLHIDGRMRFWAGGGLVADSTFESEYQETFHKAKALLQLLRTDDFSPGCHPGCDFSDLKTG